VSANERVCGYEFSGCIAGDKEIHLGADRQSGSAQGAISCVHAANADDVSHPDLEHMGIGDYS